MSTPFVQIGPGYTTAQVMGMTSRELIGSASAVSFGIGVSPIPFQIGTLTCCTGMVEGTDRVSGLNALISGCTNEVRNFGEDVAALARNPTGRATGGTALIMDNAGVVLDGSVSGRVSAQSAAFRQRPTERHPLTCTEGLRVRLEATSTFDNTLVVIDAAGQQVAFADDISSQNRNARLDFTCPARGHLRRGRRPLRHDPRRRRLHAEGGRFYSEDALRAGPGAGRAGANGAPLRMGATVQATLSPDLPNYAGKPTRFHAFPCRAGQSVQLDATSSWDNFVRVLDPSGRQVAYDDDSGPERNARVRFTCSTSGTYRAGVQSYRPGDHGAYTLRLGAPGETGGTGPTTATRPAAQTPTSSPRPSTPSSAPRPFQASGSVPGERRFEGRMTSFHRIQCVAGYRMRVDVQSSWDNVAIIVDGAMRRRAFNDDAASGNTNARIQWTCPDNAAYLIGVAAYREGTRGSYTLQVTPTGRAR